MYMAFVHSSIQRYIHCGDAVMPPIMKYYKTNIQWVYEGHDISTSCRSPGNVLHTKYILSMVHTTRVDNKYNLSQCTHG